MVTTVQRAVNNSVNRVRDPSGCRIPMPFCLAPWSDPKSGIRSSLVKPSLVHTWTNILSCQKVPKDLLIKQIPTLEVGLSRLETLSRSLTLAVTLALSSVEERFTAPAPASTSWGRLS